MHVLGVKGSWNVEVGKRLSLQAMICTETSEPLSVQEFSVILLPTAPEYDALKQTLLF